MADQEYRVRLTADTKQATEKLQDVQSTISGITSKSHEVRINIDANALRRAAENSKEVAGHIRSTSSDLKQASGIDIVSSDSLSNAAALASTFYGIRKDVRGLNNDLGRSLQKTNVSEFMRTEQFLDRVLQNSQSRTKEIVETYKNIRELPGVADTLGPVENFARAKAWETFGSEIADQTRRGLQEGARQGVEKTKGFFYKDILTDLGVGVNTTIDTLARLGLAIQGVQLLIGPLATAWSAAFDSIIGQNIRLEQTILSTQTTLASTGRIINQATGEEIRDPLQKIQALEGGVRQAIENIRIRSLDLAGVTSQQMIDIFGVVATSISQVNGNIKDAEDLAVSFTAALGTLGIPFYQARQEIGSILGGYITEDSLLAKRLQISNRDIEQAKNSVDGVVGYLQKKLETAVAGQALQAKGFAGVTSNIQEIFEVIAQSVGAPLLDPLVGGLTAIYNILKQVQGIVVEVGKYLSTTIVGTLKGIADIFKNTKLAASARQILQNLAEPYKQLALAVELGLGGRGQNLLQSWLDGTAKVPAVMEGVVNALRSFGNFLRLQLDLITAPITQLVDQTRELADGGAGFAQRVARIVSIPFGNFVELDQTFTKGWDTLSSTIAEATRILGKFIVTFASLKITEFTAQVRAAAAVFEVFGSVLLGRINLALAFFNEVANFAGTDLAKFVVSLTAINKLINQTDFFGIKGIAIWAVQTRKIFKQLIADTQLFIKGFKDAGNIDNLVKNTQAAYAKLLNVQSKSSNPAIQNAAEIAKMQNRLESLNAIQRQMAANGAPAEAMARYAKSINNANTSLAQLQQTQKSFTVAQRGSAALKTLFEGGTEAAQAKEAARQASVMASGAASSQVLSNALDALAKKLGMAREELNSFGGVAKAAGRSVMTFITTTALINIGFTALSLGIAAGISWWQQYEERVKAARVETIKMASVSKILNSGWASTIEAAEGGDAASQLKLDTLRSEAQAAISIQQEKQNKLAEEYKKKNDELYKTRHQITELEKAGANYSGDHYTYLQRRVVVEEKQLETIKKQQLKVDQALLRARKAAQLLVDEQNQAQNFAVLSERRKDIEDTIKRAREDYTKEITDKEFQSRIEYLNLEQQKRRELVEMEKAALAQRYQTLIASSSEQEAKVLQIAQEYKTALIDAVSEEEQRRSELMQKQMQLQKEIEDYAFKMAREKINLEKRVGGYKKQMEQYLNKQQEIRIQKEVASLKSQAALKGGSYEPYSVEQQQSFINATQDPSRRVDHRIAYAMLQVIPKSDLNLSGLESGDVVVEKLRKALEQKNFGIDRESLLKLIGGKDPEVLADKLIKYSEKAFNSSRFVTKQNPQDITVPDLEINWSSLEGRLKKAADQVLGVFTDYINARGARSRQQAQLILERAQDPSSFTNIKANYASEIDKSETNLKNFIVSLREWSSGQYTATAEIDAIRQQFRAEVRALVNDYVQRTNLQPILKKRNLTVDSLVQGYVSGNNKALTADGKTLIPLELPGLNELIGARRKAGEKAIRLNQNNLPSARAVASSDEVLKSLTSNFSQDQIISQRNQLLTDIIQKFDEVRASSEQISNSFENTVRSIDREVDKLKLSVVTAAKTPLTAPQMQALENAAAVMREQLVNTAKVLEPARQALENFTTRMALATQATEIMINANREFLSGLLTSGEDLKSIVEKFSQSISQGFINMFIDATIKPLQDQVLAQFKKFFGVQSAEEKAYAELNRATSGFSDAVRNFSTAVENFKKVPPPSATPPSTPPNPNTGTSIPQSNSAINPTDWTSSKFATYSDFAFSTPQQDYSKSIMDTTKTFTQQIELSASSFKSLQTNMEDVPKTLRGFQKAASGLLQGVGALAMGIGGIQLMSEGGTYNTLMGLSAIFGMIGSVAGMFGTGGAFGPAKKASGGAVFSKTPYVVGEIGPELFVPNGNGTIIPTARTQALLASRSALGTGGQSESSGMTALDASRSALAATAALTRERQATASLTATLSAPAQPLNVSYESRVINNVEYVTAEQFQRGVMDAAERGRALTLGALKNSVKARRQVGI